MDLSKPGRTELTKALKVSWVVYGSLLLLNNLAAFVLLIDAIRNSPLRYPNPERYAGLIVHGFVICMACAVISLLVSSMFKRYFLLPLHGLIHLFTVQFAAVFIMYMIAML